METRPQHDRFKDAPWFPKEDINIIIGGAGGIGSWLTLLLTRAGFKPIVYDFDRLEQINQAGQLYPTQLMGEPKVVALQKVCKEFSNEDITIFNEKITEESPTHKFCISAFDNMQARRDMYRSWEISYGLNPEALFIDSSLTAEQMFIYCIKGGIAHKEERDRYFEEYNSLADGDIEETMCTFKQTSHAAAMIASHITGFFTNHITNLVEKDNSRAVPFRWEYFIPMDLVTN